MIFLLFRKNAQESERDVEDFRCIHPYLAWLVQLIARPLLSLYSHVFLRVKVKGVENLRNIPSDTPIILAANHTSELDPPLVGAATPYFSRRYLPVYFVSSDKSNYPFTHPIKKFLYGGWFFRWSGAFNIKRGLRNYAKALYRHEEILSKPRTLVVFPEGGRMKTYEYNEKKIKGGMGYLAHKSGATVVPVYVEGLMGSKVSNILRGKQRLKVVFGKPTTFSEWQEEQDGYKNIFIAYKKFSQSVMKTVYNENKKRVS